MFALSKECNEDFKWYIGNTDAFCDDFVNTASCNFDGGDCCGPNRKINYCSQCICYEDMDCSASLLGTPVNNWFKQMKQNTFQFFNTYFGPMHIIRQSQVGRIWFMEVLFRVPRPFVPIWIGWPWWISSIPFGIPFRLPVQFWNRGSSLFIICKWLVQKDFSIISPSFQNLFFVIVSWTRI